MAKDVWQACLPPQKHTLVNGLQTAPLFSTLLKGCQTTRYLGPAAPWLQTKVTDAH